MLDPLQLNFQFIHLRVRVLLSNTQILRIAQAQNIYACNIAGVILIPPCNRTATAQQSKRGGRFRPDALPDHKNFKNRNVETFMTPLKIKCKRGKEVLHTEPW